MAERGNWKKWMIIQLSRRPKFVIHNSKIGSNIHVHWLKMY